MGLSPDTLVLCGTCLYVDPELRREGKHRRDGAFLCLMHAKAYDHAVRQIQKGASK